MSSAPPPQEPDSPGFSTVPPPEALPGFDPSDSPLAPGGRANSETPLPADTSLQGLVATPEKAGRPRVMVRVRREGWVSRRSAARSRFRNISRNRGSSTPRILSGLANRGGIHTRSKKRAVRPRFNMRGHL